MKVSVHVQERKLCAVYTEKDGRLYLAKKGDQGCIEIDSNGYVSHVTGGINNFLDIPEHIRLYTGDSITLTFE